MDDGWSKMMREKIDFFDLIMKILLVFVGLFICYQIVRIILGGSWLSDQVNTALLSVILGLCILLVKRNEANHQRINHFSRSFSSLAEDFKSHMKSSKIFH